MTRIILNGNETLSKSYTDNQQNLPCYRFSWRKDGEVNVVWKQSISSVSNISGTIGANFPLYMYLQ
jgi:hypothetical protein